ncbi:MAG: hypothetical protein NTV94_18665 [Planctomycetota bacterium]|nr:hypothetical protein [Planctomycetota bacterium]
MNERLRGRWCRGGAMWWFVWLALTGLCAQGLMHLKINNSLSAWSPNKGSAEELETYCVIGFESNGIDAFKLESHLRALPEVSWCVGPASASMLLAGGISPGGLVSAENGAYSGIYCFAKSGIDPPTLYAAVSSVLAPAGGADGARRRTPGQFALGGSAPFAQALNQASQQRMPQIVLGVLCIGGLLLFWVVRSARAACAGVAGVVLPMVMLLGAAGWAGIDLDMSFLLVPPLMISLGYSYAAHAALRVDAAAALRICGVTAMLGIAAFGTTNLPSIRTFALWGTIGTGLVWLCIMTLVPPPGQLVQDGIDRWVRFGMHRLVRRRGVAMIVGGVLIAVAGVIGAQSLRVDAQALGYFAPESQMVRDAATLEHRLIGMLPFEVLASGPASPQVGSWLEQSPLVRKVVDVTLLSRLRPDRAKQLQAAGRGVVQRTFWCLANNDALDGLEPQMQRWQQDAAVRGVTLEVRGVAAQLLEVRRQMRRVAAESIPAMLMVAALATGVLARSVRGAAAGLLANLIPVAAVSLGAAVWGGGIQMPALMVGAIGIGAGIDDAVHVVWLRRRHSRVAAMRICSRACIGSSAVGAICMLAFAFSPFRPTAQFGLLMAMILTIAAIADMLVLPAMLGRKRRSAAV